MQPTKPPVPASDNSSSSSSSATTSVDGALENGNNWTKPPVSTIDVSSIKVETPEPPDTSVFAGSWGPPPKKSDLTSPVSVPSDPVHPGSSTQGSWVKLEPQSVEVKTEDQNAMDTTPTDSKPSELDPSVLAQTPATASADSSLPSLKQLEIEEKLSMTMDYLEQKPGTAEQPYEGLFYGRGLNTMAEVRFRGMNLPELSAAKLTAVEKAKKFASAETGRVGILRRKAILQPRNAYALYHESKIARTAPVTPIDPMSKIKAIANSQQLHYTQALSLMARVYVGSINYDVKEEVVRQAFSAFGPLKSLNMSYDPATGKHMGFAFIEYDLPEAAELALAQMEGFTLGSRPIKVGRPSNMPQAQSIIEQIALEAKKFHRIYVASIHAEITEADLRTVFSAFGNVRACGLAQNTNSLQLQRVSKHKGYGYIEFDSEQAANEAIMSMNLFDLGGQLLRVGRAITPPENTSDPQLNNSPSSIRESSPGVTASGGGGGSRFSRAPKVPVPPPTVLAPDVAGPGATFTIPQPGIVTPQLYSIPTPESFTRAGSETPLTSSRVTSSPSRITSSPPRPSSVQPPTPSAAEEGNPPDLGVATTSTEQPAVPRAASPEPVLQPPAAMMAAAAKERARARKRAKKPGGQKAITGGNPGSMDGDSMALVSLDKDNPGGDKWAVATLDHHSGGPGKKRKGKGAKKGGKKGQEQTEPLEKKPEGNLLEHQLRSNDLVKEKLLNNQMLSEKQRQLIEMESTQSIASQEDIKIKGNEARNILMHKLMRRLESPILVLRNMVGPEDVDEFLEEEVMEECSKFGQVNRVIIYQEQQGTEEGAAVIVKIFVAFSLPSEAEAGKARLDGRYFGGRTVRAEIYDQRMFDSNDLTG